MHRNTPLFARLQRDGGAEHRHRPVALDGDAAVALEAHFHGRALVVGVGNQDFLVARRVGHHKLVAARRLKALDKIIRRAVRGALLVLGVPSTEGGSHVSCFHKRDICLNEAKLKILASKNNCSPT